jgi:hypothetical protein
MIIYSSLNSIIHKNLQIDSVFVVSFFPQSFDDKKKILKHTQKNKQKKMTIITEKKDKQIISNTDRKVEQTKERRKN